MRRRLTHVLPAILLAALSLACAGGDGNGAAPPTATAPAASPTPAVTVSDRVAELEERIRTRINDIRREHDLQPLEAREDVAAVARDYSELMMREEFFSHVAPDGSTVADRVRDAGINYTAVGENLFQSVGPVDHVEVAVEGWMESEGHRENILREVFTQTGVGVAIDGDTFYATQVFLTPR